MKTRKQAIARQVAAQFVSQPDPLGAKLRQCRIAVRSILGKPDGDDRVADGWHFFDGNQLGESAETITRWGFEVRAIAPTFEVGLSILRYKIGLRAIETTIPLFTLAYEDCRHLDPWHSSLIYASEACLEVIFRAGLPLSWSAIA